MATVIDTPTRRAVLGAMSLATAATVTPAAIASFPKQADRTAWDRAYAAYEKAGREAAVAEAAAEKVYAAYEAAKPSLDMIDWDNLSPAVRAHVHTKEDVAYRLDLDTLWSDYLAGEQRWWWIPDPEQNRRTKEAARAAIDAVAEFRRLDREARDATGYDAAGKLHDDTDEAAYEAKWALLFTPAPDHAALLWKIETMLTPEDGSITPYTDEAIEPLLSDARRLLSHGRA